MPSWILKQIITLVTKIGYPTNKQLETSNDTVEFEKKLNKAKQTSQY